MFIEILEKEDSKKVLIGDIYVLKRCLKNKLEEAKNRLITEKEDARFIAGIAFTLKLLLSDLEE
ncbi:MAG: hypothetical protein WDA47_07885 [Bacilli bacterium]